MKLFEEMMLENSKLFTKSKVEKNVDKKDSIDPKKTTKRSTEILNEEHDVRHYTNGILELMDEGVIDGAWLAEGLLKWMSEDDVEDFARVYDLKELIDGEEELDESVKRSIKEKFQKRLSEDLKLISDIGDYEPWSGAVETWDKIVQEDKVNDLDYMLEDMYPEGMTVTQLNDLLWFDGETVLGWLGISDVIGEHTYRVTNIVWDVDEDDDIDELPSSYNVDIEVEEEDDDIEELVRDALENEFGFSASSFDFELDESLKNKKGSKRIKESVDGYDDVYVIVNDGIIEDMYSTNGNLNVEIIDLDAAGYFGDGETEGSKLVQEISDRYHNGELKSVLFDYKFESLKNKKGSKKLKESFADELSDTPTYIKKGYLKSEIGENIPVTFGLYPTVDLPSIYKIKIITDNQDVYDEVRDRLGKSDEYYFIDILDHNWVKLDSGKQWIDRMIDSIGKDAPIKVKKVDTDDDRPLRVCDHCLQAIESHEGPQITKTIYVDDEEYFDSEEEYERESKCDWCDEYGFDTLYEIHGKGDMDFDESCHKGSKKIKNKKKTKEDIDSDKYLDELRNGIDDYKGYKIEPAKYLHDETEGYSYAIVKNGTIVGGADSVIDAKHKIDQNKSWNPVLDPELPDDMKLAEDTVKKSNGKWTNRGDTGEEHGEFKTKKAADAQRKAMYASGWKGESKKRVKESIDDDSDFCYEYKGYTICSDYDRGLWTVKELKDETFSTDTDAEERIDSILDESLLREKSYVKLGTDVGEYQEWVDYDMERYGRVSVDTRRKLRDAGLTVVKDKYGDYEVISHDPIDYRKDRRDKFSKRGYKDDDLDESIEEDAEVEEESRGNKGVGLTRI